MIIILFIDASRGLSHGKSVRPIYLGQPAIVILSDRPGSEVSRPRVVFPIVGVGHATGEFHRFASPRTADAILRQVPIGGRIVRYGEEIYFQISVEGESGTVRTSIEVGRVHYWPAGSPLWVRYGLSEPHAQ